MQCMMIGLMWESGWLLLHSGKDTDSSALEEEGDDLKALEAKIRCLGMKKKPSQGRLPCAFRIHSVAVVYLMLEGEHFPIPAHGVVFCLYHL